MNRTGDKVFAQELRSSDTTKGNDMEWWGFSTQHGWVVLDRSIPSNAPGLRDDLLFFRFKDSTTFFEKREKWNPPLYRFAPNHIRDLAADEAAEATAELEAFKAQWPAAQEGLRREMRQAAERVEAARLDEEKKRKAAAREAKKQSAESKQ